MRTKEEPEEIWDASAAEATQDILSRHASVGVGFWIAAAVTGVLFLAGILGLALRITAGVPGLAPWGYYAATLAFLLTTAMAAPLVSIGLFFTKAHLQRPISRPSILFAVTGPLVFLLLLPLLPLMLPVEGRLSIWFDWPVGAPQLWDTLALGFWALSGLLVLWITTRPDLLAIRQLGRGWRRGIASFLAANWIGNQRQWQVLKAAMFFLGALYFAILVIAQTLLSVDLSMSLVPGWRSAIYPAYHVLTSLQGAVATTIVAMAVLRLTGYRKYILFDQFWAMGRLLLSFSLLGIYFWWSELIVFWYGRTPREMMVFQLHMFGPYLPVFVSAFVFSFLGPFLTLMWNRIRMSILGPSLVAGGVLVGLFLDRIRLYVVAFSAAHVGIEPIEEIPPPVLPDVADVMMMIGFPAGVIFLYLLASRLVPVMSLWEIKEGILLRTRRRYLRTELTSLAKPK